jgi:hypothetical protein
MPWDSAVRVIKFPDKKRIRARKEKQEELVRLLAKIKEKKRLDKITKLCVHGLYLAKTWGSAGRDVREVDLKSLRQVAEELRMLAES